MRIKAVKRISMTTKYTKYTNLMQLEGFVTTAGHNPDRGADGSI